MGGLLAIDDHKFMLSALKAELQENFADYQVIECVATMQAAFAVLKQKTIDIVLLDYNLEPAEGQLRPSSCARNVDDIIQLAPQAKIILITGEKPERIASSLLELRAKKQVRGFFLKKSENLCDIIRTVANGQSSMDSTLEDLLADVQSKMKSVSLSEKMQAMIALLLENKTNDEIATALAIDKRTVSNYKTQLKEIFHAKNQIDLKEILRQHFNA